MSKKAVLVPYPIDRAYDYDVPEGLALEDGDYVIVPLGARNVNGVVWGDGSTDKIPANKVKSVFARYDLPPMPEAQRRFLTWAAHYTMSDLGSFLKLSLSVPGALDPPREVKGFRIANFTSYPNLHTSKGGKAYDQKSSPRMRGEDLGGGRPRSGKRWKHLLQNARALRKNLTEAEKILWRQLRLKQHGVKFRRQYEIGQYIVDFICLERGLIIEVDGGQHAEVADANRDEFLTSEGFRVVRFWNNEVFENLEGVMERIVEAVKNPPSKPSPLERGEGFTQQQVLLPSKEGVFRWGDIELSLSPPAKRVMEIAADGLARKASELAREAGASAGVIKTLANKGLLEEVTLTEPPPCRRPDTDRARAVLSEAQDRAAQKIITDVNADRFSATLLDGVTGSGKTEVYFEGVAAALEQGRQVMILLPEIALSNAFLSRFKDRFGCAPALWHSSLSDHQRKVTWRGVASGESRVVVGARSALFLPYKELGLIIVDEEHDSAYKQEEGVIYHARDMAVVRASMGKIPIVLVSATPSLETMQNVWLDKYAHLHLPGRHGGAEMPDVHLVDLTKDRPERQHFISPTLKKAVAQTIENAGQALLFLNRRGYAPLTLCRNCGHRFECPRCTAWLIEHRKTGKLHCHHCGHEERVPPQCPKCGEADSLAACGPGVERVMEEVKEIFPDARTLILSSDTATTHEQLKSMLDDIHGHKVDIIIGTQIIAKGHHFPKLTCVGVIDADLALSGGDLRASERTFQLLHQVAGRAGREAEKGHVYLQTFNPDSRVMQALAADDRDEFLEVEAGQREAAKMPPFTRLAGIIVSGRDEALVIDVSKKLGQSAPYGPGLQTLGPADAPMYRLRGKFRRRLLVRAEKTLDIQKALAHWLQGIKIPATVRVQVDMDPQSFY